MQALNDYSGTVTLSFTSTDPNFSGSLNLNSVTLANDTKPATLAIFTTAGMVAGAYSLTVKGTFTNSVGATETRVGVVVITVQTDLVISSVSGPVTTATGQTILLANTVTNQGPGAAPSFDVSLYLSIDATITSADTYLGVRSVASLAAGASNTASSSVTVPAGLYPRTYYYGAIADSGDSVPESNEANNGRAGNAAPVIGADLVISSVSGPVTAIAGESITLTDTVTNQGVGAAPSFSVSLYLSTDTTITTSDILVNSYSVTGLAAGASSTSSGSLIIPGGLAGIYYYGAIADTGWNVRETNETNNSGAGNAVAVTGADLVMSSISGPTTTAIGKAITITDTVTNQGIGASSHFEVYLYLSTDATITTADTYLGSRYIANLAPGASNTASSSVTIPSSLAHGTYYYGAIADRGNDVGETNETNNARAGNSVAVAGSDLVMSSISGPTTTATGKVITLTDTVTNQGAGAASGFLVWMYLSTDATITTADTFLGYRSVGSLAAGASNTASSSVTIPSNLKPGTYYYGAIADRYNEVGESSETNNARAGNTVVVGP